jgi:hypothetical protein
MSLCFVAWLVISQARAIVIAPKAVDTTIRSYEVIGLSIQTPATIYTAPAGQTLATPARGVTAVTIMITYVDNLGTQYADVHTDTSGAAELIAAWLDSAGAPVRERLLQHLIDEKKIPAAKISTPQKGK